MKTANGFAQEILERKFNGASTREFNECAGLIEARDAEIRQACAAEYQQREADGPIPINFYRGGQNSREREISELKAIIDEARKLGEATRGHANEGRFHCEECRLVMLEVSGELLAVLDRSGARGGSVKVKLTHSGRLEMLPISDEDLGGGPDDTDLDR